MMLFGSQVRSVDRLAVARGGLHELAPAYPAVLVGDLLGNAHRQVLGALHRADELPRLEERLHGAGVEPCEPAAEGDDRQRPVLEVHAVEVGDLELAARGGLDLFREFAHAGVVEVQARDGVAGLRMLGLLLDGDRVESLVELHDAEALGVVDVVAEHRRPRARLGAGHRVAQALAQPVAVEDVVAEHERAGLAGDEGLADDECLGESVGARLLGVGERDPELRPVAEEPLEVREVCGRRDQQDVAYPREHEGRERVVDHGLVVDGKQLLARHRRQRVEAGARPAGEDYAFHVVKYPFLYRIQYLYLQLRGPVHKQWSYRTHSSF